MRIKWRREDDREATNWEREILCAIARIDKQRALQDEVLSAGEDPKVLIPVMPELCVVSYRLRWGRGGGRLYSDTTVRLSSGSVHRFKHRVKRR